MLFYIVCIDLCMCCCFSCLSACVLFSLVLWFCLRIWVVYRLVCLVCFDCGSPVGLVYCVCFMCCLFVLFGGVWFGMWVWFGCLLVWMLVCNCFGVYLGSMLLDCFRFWVLVCLFCLCFGLVGFDVVTLIIVLVYFFEL